VPTIDVGREFNSGWDADQIGTFDTDLHRLHLKLEEMGHEIEQFNFREALRILMEISSAGNALLQFNEPWKAIKDDPELVKVVLHLALQYVAALSVALRPFLPFAAERLRGMLNLQPLDDDGDMLYVHNELAEGNPIIRPNHALNAAEHLFTRIPDEIIGAQVAKLQASAQVNQMLAGAPAETPAEATAPPPVRDEIQYDDFAKLDIRTGTIVEASKVEKADKLLKLTVDLGFEKRTIVSGIALHYQPEAIVGRQVVVLANLAPRKMRGIDSQGMILMAEDAEGRLSFVSPEAGWPDGWGVK